MNERFEQAVSLVPAALDVVLYKPEAIVDDTCLSRLLSWFEENCNCEERAAALLSVVGDFVSKVATAKHPVAIAFGLKISTVSHCLLALCWKNTVTWIADERLLEHGDAAVRCAAYNALRRLTHFPEAVQMLRETDLVAVSLTGLNDGSMFVSKAASGFLCYWLHFSAEDKTVSNATIRTGVSDVLLHFKSLFESSSVVDGVSSVFAVADELMQVFPRTAGSFIVATQLLKLSDIAVMKGDRNVCLSVVGFLSSLVRVGRELDVCWRDLLGSHASGAVDDAVVVRDWLMKHPIVLLQRGFAQLAFTCLSNYFSFKGSFNLDHCHTVIAEMIMSPLSFVLGEVTSHHTLKPSEEDTLSQFCSALEIFIEDKHQCILVTCACLGLTGVTTSSHCSAEYPLGVWCRSVCTILKLSAGVSVPQEILLTSYGSHLIGSHKVTQAALRSLPDFINTELADHQCSCVVEVLLDLLQISSLLPKVTSMALRQLLAGVVKLKDQSDHWSARISQMSADLLASPHWEVRDSALEFISSVLEACKAPGLFCGCDGIPLAVWRSLNDAESYVRASALSALGQLSLHDKLLSPLLLTLNLTPDDIVQTVCGIAKSDTEAFARRSAVQLLCTWLTSPHFGDCLFTTRDHDVAVLCPVVQNVLHVAMGDLDWEVKLLALAFWEKLLESDRFDSTAAAVKFLSMSGGAGDLVAAAGDHDKAVRRKSIAVLKCIMAQVPVSTETVLPNDTRVQDFVLQLAAFDLDNLEHQEQACADDNDIDAYSMLEDVLACADETISSDCKLLDCY